MLSGSELWLLRLMADRGRALLDADTLIIIIAEGDELRVPAVSGEGAVRLRILPMSGSAVGEVYRKQAPLHLQRPRGRDAAWLHELGLEARAVLTEPLMIDAQPGGLVVALSSRTSFKEPDRRALHAFAESVARRLQAERSVEIERLRFGMQARERERARWAREIHDETIQGLGALKLGLANARDLHDPSALREAVDLVIDGLSSEIDGLRHLITELRPAALDDLGLAAALEALARRAQAVDQLHVRTQIDLAELHGGGRLDPELESTIYRVVQEALTNVSKHAHAKAAVISVAASDRLVTASVTDDGKGISRDPRAGQRSPEEELRGGFGMSGMRERAELVGGELQIEPRPEGGTVVTLTVPLSGRRAPSATGAGPNGAPGGPTAAGPNGAPGGPTAAQPLDGSPAS